MIMRIGRNLWAKKGVRGPAIYEPDTTWSPYSSPYRQKCNRYCPGSSIRINYKSDILCNWVPPPLDPLGEWILKVMTIYQRNRRYKRRQGGVELPRSAPVRKQQRGYRPEWNSISGGWVWKTGLGLNIRRKQKTHTIDKVINTGCLADGNTFLSILAIIVPWWREII